MPHEGIDRSQERIGRPFADVLRDMSIESVYNEAKRRGAGVQLAHDIAMDVTSRGTTESFMAGRDRGVQYGVLDAPSPLGTSRSPGFEISEHPNAGPPRANSPRAGYGVSHGYPPYDPRAGYGVSRGDEADPARALDLLTELELWGNPTAAPVVRGQAQQSRDTARALDRVAELEL